MSKITSPSKDDVDDDSRSGETGRKLPVTDSSAHAANAAAAPASAARPAALEPGEPLDDEEVVVALGVADARWLRRAQRCYGGLPRSCLGNCAASAESSAAHASRSAAAASARARQLSDAESVVATFASGTPM